MTSDLFPDCRQDSVSTPEHREPPCAGWRASTTCCGIGGGFDKQLEVPCWVDELGEIYLDDRAIDLLEASRRTEEKK